MSVIKILPKSISELINAGEVVDRPASIVKELVENSLDAKSNKITIEIKNGGITFLSVSDDGIGIEKEDLPTAFIRHATSKIATKEDLEKISTMGFRGEALPSVAAVSHVTLSSKPQAQEVGWQYDTDTGEVAPKAMANGTVIVVKDLFYNTPARMKFLKKDITEGNAVESLLERMCLSNPSVSFTFIRDGKIKLKTYGDGSLITAMRTCFSSEIAKNMTEVNYNSGKIKISGLISTPPMSRQSRNLETFFINERFIHSKTCQAALEEAYKNKLMSGKFPICCLNISVDFSSVDVNIHPAKLEVRFENEREIYNAVYTACIAALNNNFRLEEPKPVSKINPFSLYDFDHSKEQTSFESQRPREVLRDTSSFSQNGEIVYTPTFKLKNAQIDIEVEENENNSLPTESDIIYEKEAIGLEDDISSISATDFNDENQSVKNDNVNIDKPLFYSDKIADVQETNNLPINTCTADILTIAENLEKEETKIVPYKVIGEVFQTYILVEQGNNFILIDKHAAHEGYIYHSIKDSFALGSFSSQLTLIPIAVALGGEEYFAICENLSILKSFGITAEDFGNNTIIIREIPQVLENCDMNTILSDIASGILKGKNNPTPDYFDRLLYSVSCRAATMAGKSSTLPELSILAELCLSKGISFCPHGRPCKIEISKNRLDKMFGRLI